MHRSAVTVTAAALVALAPFAASTTTGGLAVAEPGASADARAATYRVVARINRTDVVAGERVRITGRVRPRAAGRVVVLQQRRDGTKRWKTSGRSTIRRNGTFVLRDRPSTRGLRAYRVLKPASDGVRAGTSRELRLAVWGWQRLVRRAVGASDGVTYDSPQLGAEVHPASIVADNLGPPSFVEYTLGRRCRTLRATYALTDYSVTGATGTAAVTVDGTTVWSTSLGIGTIVRDQVTDVTDVFRLRFDLTATASPAGYVAIGTPEVLCLD